MVSIKEKKMMNIRLIFVLFFIIVSNIPVFSQDITTNRNPVGLEHNLLFNARTRYTVTQSGVAPLNLDVLFDGAFAPSYSNTAVSVTNPTVITISGLPSNHSQAGTWIGWSTRYWPASKFKIEAYNTYINNQYSQYDSEQWIVVADYSETYYSGNSYSVQITGIIPSKIRFTFYEGTGTDGRFGVSELFLINTEATTPYSGLLESLGTVWSKSNSNIIYNEGNVLIGKATQTNSAYKLDVDGEVRANGVIVNTSGADFVFDPDYRLPGLDEVEIFIKMNGHLPDIASAGDMQSEGVEIGDMQMKLLQKIEELTLYLIDQEKKHQKTALEVKRLAC